ncbi:glycosyltransferase [Schleiferilactobacillus shenzhenensis]|nr:glycosyltransferase [Schleiferilactobacillus shenzhenensis]
MTLTGIALMICLALLAQLSWHMVRNHIVIERLESLQNSKRQEAGQKTETPELFVVIPCLREQTTILDTMDYFLELTSNSENIHLVIVTTEKEKAEARSSDYVTTYSVIRKKITGSLRYSGVTLLNYPKTDGMMAHQLNYAARYIKEHSHANWSKSYFVVYNADSRPGRNVFREVYAKAFDRSWPKVMQEYSAFFLNLDSLSPLMRGFAVYQTNFELTNGYTNSILYSDYLRSHVVGHGLYLRFDFLDAIGGFTTRFWCEDIYLSFYLRSIGVRAVPIDTVEIAEAPKSMSVLIKQNANWFKTLSETTKIYHSLSDEIFNTRAFLYWMNQLRGAAAWVLLPSAYVLLAVALLVTQNWVISALFCITLWAPTTMRYLLTLRLFRRLNMDKIDTEFRMSVLGSAAYLVSNLGPLYGLTHLHAQKYKTER